MTSQVHPVAKREKKNLVQVASDDAPEHPVTGGQRDAAAAVTKVPWWPAYCLYIFQDGRTIKQPMEKIKINKFPVMFVSQMHWRWIIFKKKIYI